MKVKEKILVTGGAGYIGSHTVVELIESGHKVVVVDNLDNGSEVAIQRVREITGCGDEQLIFKQIDLLDLPALEAFFSLPENMSEPFQACIHFAALKAVGESVNMPLHYYYNNVTATISLLNLLSKHNCKNFVFSSSACVYGDPESVPIPETAPTRPENPYGRTKEMIEKICADASKSNAFQVLLLRYFNPIGAHASGKIGEDPQGFPNNLLPFVAQVAVGRRPKLNIFGGDYDTIDGTGVRDYVHVVDVAKGHVKALQFLLENDDGKDPSKGRVEIVNLGTGKGVSVLEIVKAFSKACGKEIKYEIVDRRPGDIATCFAKVDKAKELLGFEAEKGVDEMCKDAWRWQKNNPNGFRTKEDIAEREKIESQGGKIKRKGMVFDLLGDE